MQSVGVSDVTGLRRKRKLTEAELAQVGEVLGVPYTPDGAEYYLCVDGPVLGVADMLVSVGVGVVLPLTTTFLAQWLEIFERPGVYLLIFASLCCAAGLALTGLRARPIRARLHCVFWSIPVGVVLDAAAHLNLHGYVYDRNLLPFEVLVLMIAAALPLYGGGLVSRVSNNSQASERQTQNDQAV